MPTAEVALRKYLTSAAISVGASANGSIRAWRCCDSDLPRERRCEFTHSTRQAHCSGVPMLRVRVLALASY